MNINENYKSGLVQTTEWCSFFADSKWQNKATLTADELTDIKNNGVDFILERKGATVNIYINGSLKFTYTLTEKDGFDYANKKAGLNIQYCQDRERSSNYGFTLDVRESAPAADGE